MKTKKLLSIAIIAALPFSAYATTFDNNNYTYSSNVTIGTVPANGMVTISNTAAPHPVVTITDDDATHIASTAYVKGAYNDTIAGINKLAYDFNDIAGTVASNVQTLRTGVGTLQSAVSALQEKRIEVHTTWGSSNTVKVEFVDYNTPTSE